MGDNHQSEEDKAVELWKVKNLIKSLEAARGNGTSMISLILPVRKRDEWKETEIENMNEKTTNEWKEKTLERERERGSLVTCLHNYSLATTPFNGHSNHNHNP